MYTTIVLAADGSEHSLRATDEVIHIATSGNNDVSIYVLYVIDEDDAKSDVLHNWNELDFSYKRKAQIKPIEDKLSGASLSYETVILRGDPGPTVVDYVNEHEVDLVVIGSRGLNPLQEFVLGSVSHKVAKRANSSVLIVK